MSGMSGDSDQQTPEGIIIGPGEGRRIEIPGVSEITTVKAAAADTSGKVSVHEEWHGADDTGVPRHFHHQLDELFYILEGIMRFLVGQEEIVAGPGAFIYAPHGVVHAWRPVGTGPVRQLVIFIPGGFEGYLDEMQTVPLPQQDPVAWQELNRRWDVEVVGPPLENR
jgi:mannose-6-phosphate isomerase-like protein (cupin superfamily)